MMLTHFNSIKVRLKHFYKSSIKDEEQYFNSIKVRLKRQELLQRIYAVPHFNSIKVRLKLLFHTLPPDFKTFQFHKGTIKTWSGTANDDKLLIFQFHKGTIKTVLMLSVLVRVLHFNSIKVRLKLVSVDTTTIIHSFQFHKGTIKTLTSSPRPFTAFSISIP